MLWQSGSKSRKIRSMFAGDKDNKIITRCFYCQNKTKKTLQLRFLTNVIKIRPVSARNWC